MRLPASHRDWLEMVCRAAAFALLAFIAYRALVPAAVDRVDDVRVSNLTDLDALSSDKAHSRIHFALNGMPTSTERSWQQALGDAGSVLSWSGQMQSIAIAARPIASPSGGYLVSAYSPKAASVIVRDDISAIDSTNAQNRAQSIAIPVASGNVRAVAGNDSAFVRLSDSVVLKRILVIGKAGWETKFLLAALEEAGWRTDALISVAPAITVSQGAVTTIDTAKYSAVIALDESAAARSIAINSFVRSGGGLILGEPAARVAAFASLRVSMPSGTPRSFPGADTVTRGSTPFIGIYLSREAVALEEHNGNAALAAKRVDFGRVVQVAYVDTWRWRMQGSAGAISDHRDWWSNLLSQTVHATRVNGNVIANDPAPYTSLVEIAGTPVAGFGNSKPLSQRSNEIIWLTLACALLLTEWTSRRMRGVR